MKIKAITILIFCSIITFVSCKKEEKVTNQAKDKIEIDKDIKPDSLTLLYKTTNKDNTEEIRITAYGSIENDKYFLARDKNFILVSKDEFAVGVENKMDTSDYETFLYYTIAPKLMMLDLLEIVKVAGMQWQRIKTSKNGHLFLSQLELNKLKEKTS